MLFDHDLYSILDLLHPGATEAGDLQTLGRHYLLAPGPYTGEELRASARELGLPEAELLDLFQWNELATELGAGAILAVDSQGFQDVSCYDTAEELAEAWKACEQEEQDARDEAEAEMERSIRSEVDAELPERWTIVHHAWTGCHACPRAFETREEAEEAFDRALALLREEGFNVEEQEPEAPEQGYIARAEVHDPEEALMVSDESGILEIRWNGPARAAEIERRLERAQAYGY